MSKQFETERFDLVQTDRVHIDDYSFGHSRRGELDVWIESSRLGKRFLRQVTVHGQVNAVNHGAYTTECYFLRERATGRIYFLDRDARGFYLQSDLFFGAEAFLGEEARKITTWLADPAQVHPYTPVEGDTMREVAADGPYH